MQKGICAHILLCFLTYLLRILSRNRTCLKLHSLLWMRTSNVIIHNIAYSGS